MHANIRRTALSLCILTALATPAWASDGAPITNAHPISAPVEIMPISAPINAVPMTEAPLLLGGRTLVSADALTAVFGFDVAWGADGTLGLTSPAKEAAAPKQEVWAVEPGTIKEVQTGERNRILIAGRPMLNGEGSLNWATITTDTVITVKEGDASRSGTFADLTAGAEIEVRWTGPMLRSYPGQGTAAAVVVFVR